MKLPHYTDYQSAVQNPQLAFKQDSDLRACRVETDPLGRPRVRAGNFAYTYRLDGTGKQWAVRCFSKYIPDQRRYEAISRFLNTRKAPFFVTTDYLSQGILINGKWYPIIKMQWKQGQTLGAFVERNITNSHIISNILNRFRGLATTLDSVGVAHGDLQHGNIIVSNGGLFLVDYDGMYVPKLAGLEAKERGHSNYQHPARDKEFGPHLDRFSSIVIYLALKALTLNPNLWDKYSTGENLLFRQRDFLSPDASSLLSDLARIPALHPLIKRFRAVCKTTVAQVPTLTDFLSGKEGVLPESTVAVTRWDQYEIVSALQRPRLLEVVGERVTVVGEINEYYQGVTKYNKPYVFLSFGNWRRGDFRLVIWSEALELFQSRGKELKSYEGKWASVTGLLTEYQKGSWAKRPQIEVESPAAVKILSGVDEAKRRLSGQTDSRPSTLKTSSSTQQQTITPARPSPANLKLAEEHFVRAWKYDEQEGRLDKAIKEYQAVLRIIPNYANAHNNLGWIYERQGRLDEAVREYETAIQIDSSPSLTYCNLGRVYGQKKRFDKAIEMLLAALEIAPNDANAHFQLGWVYGAKGRLDKAIEEYQTALQIDPQLGVAHLNLGWAYSRQGRHDKAVREYKRALQINPENGMAHSNLGLVYKTMGRIDDARRELELAVKCGFEPAKNILREMAKDVSVW